MTFSIWVPECLNKYFPPAVMYYLSGLTCTDDNAKSKGGFLAEAKRLNMLIVFPDTSPRGIEIDGQDDAYDFGSGAGFYVNATEDKWKKNYNMYDYVTKELPEFL